MGRLISTGGGGGDGYFFVCLRIKELITCSNHSKMNYIFLPTCLKVKYEDRLGEDSTHQMSCLGPKGLKLKPSSFYKKYYFAPYLASTLFFGLLFRLPFLFLCFLLLLFAGCLLFPTLFIAVFSLLQEQG